MLKSSRPAWRFRSSQFASPNERHLRLAISDSLERPPKRTFLRAWCAIAYFYPGLHPDSYEFADSDRPRVWCRAAAEAWRRADASELTDNELWKRVARMHKAQSSRFARPVKHRNQFSGVRESFVHSAWLSSIRRLRPPACAVRPFNSGATVGMVLGK